MTQPFFGGRSRDGKSFQSLAARGPCRQPPETHCSSAEGAVGEVEARAKNSLPQLVVRDGMVASCYMCAEPSLMLIKRDQ